jgi:hypothetical protein
LRQFDQYYLPIDLRHFAWIATALLGSSIRKGLIFIGGRYRADVSVAKDRRCLASHAESSRKRQSRAGKNKYQSWTGKPFQGNLSDTSDFLLRYRDPAPLRNRSELSCPGYPHASSDLAAGGRAHDTRSKPRRS